MIKRIRIQAYQVGLVFENRKLTKVLQEGVYWISWKKEVSIFEMKQSFVAPMELNILLENETLASLLEVVEIADNEISLYFANGIFKEVLGTGRYAFWKGYAKNEFIKADNSKVEITENIPVHLMENAKIRAYIRRLSVLPFEKGLLFVNGKLVKEVGPGIHYFWNNGITVEIKTMDIRQQQMEISGQEILTKDKATLRINFFAQYQMIDIMKALQNNKEVEKQLYIVLQLALRALVGGYTLDELLHNKEAIVASITKETKEQITALGIQVVEAGIRDIILPGDMKEIMN